MESQAARWFRENPIAAAEIRLRSKVRRVCRRWYYPDLPPTWANRAQDQRYLRDFVARHRGLLAPDADVSDVGAIYVIGDETACKIGYTRAPQRRLMELQLGTYIPLRLIGLLAADPPEPVEAVLHWLLRTAHIRGEWYRREVVDALLAALR